MSFPKRFVVERASASGGGFAGVYPGMWDNNLDTWPFAFGMWPYLSSWPYFGDPFYSSAFYSPYYSPFGYGRWGYYYNDYYRYYGNSIIVIDSTGTGGVTTPQASGEGRVVDGRGYTRIRRTEPDPPNRINNGNGGGWGTASAGGGSSTSSGSGSSGVSSGGYSSGGGGGGGDRVAVPRPPGL
jgi:hypothetical protein